MCVRLCVSQPFRFSYDKETIIWWIKSINVCDMLILVNKIAFTSVSLIRVRRMVCAHRIQNSKSYFLCRGWADRMKLSWKTHMLTHSCRCVTLLSLLVMYVGITWYSPLFQFLVNYSQVDVYCNSHLLYKQQRSLHCKNTVSGINMIISLGFWC